MHVSRFLVVAAMAASALAAVMVPRFPRPTPLDLDIDVDLTAAASADDTFLLQTQAKNSSNYDGLYVFAYHTGAGLNDAMLIDQQSTASPATTKPGNVGGGGDRKYFEISFHFGNAPYELIPSTGPTPYAGLLPVRINVNDSPPSSQNAFYFEGNTLQWTDSAGSSSPGGFGGWLDHPALGNPNAKGVQLFYRSGSGGSAPAGCADVDLLAVY